jgi:MFS family permease
MVQMTDHSPAAGTGAADVAASTKAAAQYPASVGRVLLLVATALLVLTQLYAAIPLAGPVGSDLGGPATFALSTVFSLCYAAGFLFWGPITDRSGTKRVMIAGLAGLTALTLACAFAGSLPILAVLRGLQGFAAASIPPAAFAYLAVSTAPRWRTTAIGAVSTSFLVSGILGQLFASAVAQRLGWNWVFIIGAVGLAVAAAAVALLITEPARQRGTGGVREQFVAALRLTQRPRMLLLCAAQITLLLSFVAMYSALGPHVSTLGLDSSQTMLLRLVALPGMFATLLVGPLSQRLSLSAIARTGFVVAAVGLLAEASLASTLIGTAVGSLVFVTGVSLAVSAMISLFGEAAVPHQAAGMALNGFVLFLGASLGPLAPSTGLTFAALLTVLAALLAISAGLLTAYPKLRTTAHS